MLHAKKDKAVKVPKAVIEPTAKKVLGKARKKLAPKVPRTPKMASY